MKSALFLSSLVLAATAAVADSNSATTANVFGVLRVDSTSTRTIVSVPWIASGSDSSYIAVADLVKTSNLTAGDTLSYYDASTGNFKVWTLSSDTPGTWTPTSIVSANAQVSSGTPSNDQTLPRGSAIILVRQNASQPFYLQGQYTSAAAASTAFESGSATSPAYSLVASPSTSGESYSVNSATWTDVGANDLLYIPTSGATEQCVRKDGAWKVAYYDTSTGLRKVAYKDPSSVASGTGFWFVSKSGTSPSVQW